MLKKTWKDFMDKYTVNTDWDGTFFKGKNGHLAFDHFLILDREYGYDGIYDQSLNAHEKYKQGDWSRMIEEIVKVAGLYEVHHDNFLQSAEDLALQSKLPKYSEKVLSMLPVSGMNIFSGSPYEPLEIFIEKNVKPILPNDTITRVFGTEMEFGSDDILTGKTIRMWDSKSRAEKAKQLTGNGKSINFGNSENDIEMLKNGTISFFLTNEKIVREENIIYTNLNSIPFYIRNLA